MHGFSQKILFLFRGVNFDNFNVSFGNLSSKMMEFDHYVFCSWPHFWSVRYFNGAVVVFEDGVFMDLLQSSIFTTIPTSINSCISGIVSRRAVDKAMCSASVVESAISV